ncbi:MAG TPA: hypothetical protein VEI95_08530 [Acidobacteriota bacterium]|nr:hypothetical protein [Acidobacteriota bacterium]
MHMVDRQRTSLMPHVYQTAIFFILVAGYSVWSWSDVLGEFGGDNAYYLLMAHYFSPWSEHSPVITYFAVHNQYPPFYPMVLALFGGADNLLAAHLITTTLLLFAFAVYYAWQRTLGFSTYTAGLIVLLFALLPGTYMQALSVLSENLYLLSSLGCLASVGMFESGRRERWLWIATVSVAAAVLTRSAGASLLAAFLLYLVFHRPRGSWRFILGAILPVVLWNLLGPHQSPGYLSSLAEKYGPDPISALLRQFSLEIRMLWHGWVGNFTTSSVGPWVMAVIGALGLLGTVRRIFFRKLDGIYVGIYICLIIVWPFPAEAQRLLFVIVPVLMAQCLLLLDRLPPLILSERRVLPCHLILLVLAVVAAPDLLLTVKRFSQPMPDQMAKFRRSIDWYAIDPAEARSNVAFDRSLTDHLKSLSKVVPEGDCIYSIKPSLVGYYAGRVSMIPPRPNFDATAFNTSLRQTGCRYFYLMGFLSPSYPIAYYPLARLGDALAVVSVSPGSPDPGRPVGVLAMLKDN